MHIAQVSPLVSSVPPPAQGGTERVVHDLVEALVRRGHDVTLFASSGSCTTARLVDLGTAQLDDPGSPRSLLAVREAIMLDRVAAMADEFDVIHCHVEFFHAAVLRHLHDKLVTTVHWRTDQADRRRFLEHFDALRLVALSASQASAMPARNVAGIIPHGIDEHRYRLDAAPGDHCAFLGRMTDQKRPDRAIDIARDAGLTLELGGDRDPGNPTYFDEHVRPRLDARTRYVGPVAETDKQRFLGSARALLFPIDWPEPFGLVMIEAMACGTPVVAWRNGSAAEVVDDGVTGFVVDDHRAAVRALRRACELDRARVRARFEERFTATRMAREHEALYARLGA